MLGQARFMYITDAARGMLDQGGYLHKAPPKAAAAPGADLPPMEESSSSEEEEVCNPACPVPVLPGAILKEACQNRKTVLGQSETFEGWGCPAVQSIRQPWQGGRLKLVFCVTSDPLVMYQHKHLYYMMVSCTARSLQ